MPLLIKNKYAQLVLALLLGSALTYLFMPTKVEVKTEEVVKFKDRIVHQVKTITKDGKVTIITDTHDVSHETIKKEHSKTTGLNQKRLLVYGGVNVLDKDKWALGASYNVYGPFDIGATYQSGVYLTAGIRF